MVNTTGIQIEESIMDIDSIREHLKTLNDEDLNSYMRMSMRNGDNTRVALADMERENRR